MDHIRVTDLEGREHRIPAREGWRVMEIIREQGLGMKAECGGCCACATCHVYISGRWTASLQPASGEELGMMDFLPESRPNSRLACQIVYTPILNGLELALAPC